jgi:thymidylate kinase
MTSLAGKRVLTISFSGIDGAGKSTQITALRDRLAARGLRVRVIPFWDEIACLTGMRETAGQRIFGGDKGIGSPSRPIERRDKNVRAWPMSWVRLLLYTLDGLSARLVLESARRSSFGVVIFDRWIYDELANQNLGSRFNRLYVRLLANLVPKPDLGFYLDAVPEQARARKPEYPLSFLVANRSSYLRLSQLIHGITVIPPAPVEEVEQFIADRVCAFESAALLGIDPHPATN